MGYTELFDRWSSNTNILGPVPDYSEVFTGGSSLSEISGISGALGIVDSSPNKYLAPLMFPDDVDTMRGLYIRVYGIDVDSPKDLIPEVGMKILQGITGLTVGVGTDVNWGANKVAEALKLGGGTGVTANNFIEGAKYFTGTSADKTTGTAATGGVLTSVYGTAINKALIFLPMPMDVSTTYSAGWNAENLDPITQYPIKHKLGDSYGPFMARQFMLQGGRKVASFFGQESTAIGALKAMGKVFNPYTELMYDSPKLRTFSYDWTLSPKNKGEAENLRKIIYILKKSMHPVVPGNGSVEESIIWELPDYVDLTFVDNASNVDFNINSSGGGQSGSENSWLFKMKKCAISSVTVHYDNKFHTDGSPSAVSLNIQFMETELLTQRDYAGSDTHSY